MPTGYKTVSAMDCKGREYNTEEMRQILKDFYPDNMEAFCAMFPTLSKISIDDRLRKLGLQRKPKTSAIDRNGKEYSYEEMRAVFTKLYKINKDAILYMFPNMSYEALLKRGQTYGLIAKPKGTAWTSEDDAILRTTWPNYERMAQRLPGRTVAALEMRCHRLKITAGPRPKYTQEEDAILRRAGKLPGRSSRSIEKRCNRLGINRHFVKSVSKLTPTELLERIGNQISRGYPEHIRDDVIYSIYSLCLEGKCSAEVKDLQAAAKKAVTAVYKLHPDRGAPVSMDARLFDDGTATVGDRISSDTFHF